MIGKYTVNEVEERSKVPAGTLRQWERRYGFPMPERSDSGYRLYSDRDLELIDAMRRHIEDGVPASRAAELVQKMSLAAEGPRPVVELVAELTEALVALDEARANEIISEAFALHTVETVLLDVIAPCMVELGRRWQGGELPVSTEHFASNLVQSRLRALFSLGVTTRHGPVIVVACAPGNRHELGALILAVLLRRAGYRVYYLGADTPVQDLAEMAARLKPAAVMLSAVTSSSLEALMAERLSLKALSARLIFGGPAFEGKPELAHSLGGTFMGNDLKKAVANLSDLLQEVRV